MRSADSGSVSSAESIILHMLDWWLERKEVQARVAQAVEATSPHECESINPDIVGRAMLAHFEDWRDLFLRDLGEDSFASYLWNTSHLRSTRKWHIEGIDSRISLELSSRIGCANKGWIDKHRKTILKNQVAMRAVRKVQET